MEGSVAAIHSGITMSMAMAMAMERRSVLISADDSGSRLSSR